MDDSDASIADLIKLTKHDPLVLCAQQPVNIRLLQMVRDHLMRQLVELEERVHGRA